MPYIEQLNLPPVPVSLSINQLFLKNLAYNKHIINNNSESHIYIYFCFRLKGSERLGDLLNAIQKVDSKQ